MNSSKNHVCPIDKRRFATRQALQQHRQVAHAAAAPAAKPRAPSRGRGRNRARPARNGGGFGAAPVAMGGRQSLPGAASDIQSGSDLFAVADLPAQSKAGTVIARLVISPRLFEGTRLTQVARMWTRWRPRRLEFVIQTTLPTVAGGQIIAAWSADDREILPADQVGMVRKLGALRPCVVSHAWEVIRLSVPCDTVQKWLYTDTEQDDSRHGVLWVCLTGALTQAQGRFQAMVQCNWAMVFEAPDVPVATENKIVQADEGYYPYYTTYSSHLEHTDRLTFECTTAGGYGSIVRFSAMTTDTVYVPKQDITYIKSDNSAGKVGALVRMKEVSDPFAWAFADVAHAEAYIKGGAIDQVLAYKAGGSWTNGNPILEEKAALLVYADNTNRYGVSGSDPFLLMVGDGVVRDNTKKGANQAAKTQKFVAELKHAFEEEAFSRPYGTLASPIVTVTAPVEAEGLASPFSELSLQDLSENPRSE